MLVPEAVRGVHPSRRQGYFADPHARPMGAGMELAARHRDGTEFPAEISLSAIDTDEGMLVAVAIRDVTDRRRESEALARLASIVQSSHDAIVGKTLDGRIASWNPGAERLYGFGADDVLGKHASLLFPPERQAEEAGIIATIARGERVERYRTERIRK